MDKNINRIIIILSFGIIIFLIFLYTNKNSTLETDYPTIYVEEKPVYHSPVQTTSDETEEEQQSEVVTNPNQELFSQNISSSKIRHNDYFDKCCLTFSELSGFCTEYGKAICSDGMVSLYCFCIERDEQDFRGCCSWHHGMSDYCYLGRVICNDGELSPSCTCNNW